MLLICGGPSSNIQSLLLLHTSQVPPSCLHPSSEVKSESQQPGPTLLCQTGLGTSFPQDHTRGRGGTQSACPIPNGRVFREVPGKWLSGPNWVSTMTNSSPFL